MLPLSDGIPTRRLPVVNVAIIVANFAVWLFYELPHLQSAVFHASFYPCSVNGMCHAKSRTGLTSSGPTTTSTAVASARRRSG